MAKVIIADRAFDDALADPLTPSHRRLHLLKLSRLFMEAEIPTIEQIDRVCRQGKGLLHLSGVHKLRYSPLKADELRFFWGGLWGEDTVIHAVPHLKDYIETVCEASLYRAGPGRRPMGLIADPRWPILDTSPRQHGPLPWRTRSWREARTPAPLLPRAEFYPFLTDSPTEEHALLLAVDRLVPKTLNADLRMDICQDVLVDILAGDLTLAQVQGSVSYYIRRFFKMNHLWKAIALDAPIFAGRTRTLAEVLAAVEDDDSEPSLV